jgi:predicted flap endonuclease-1-like 5' DNA nuclease
VTAALDAFPGRIERDDWMSSAAEQHQSKYGEPA